MTATPGQQQTQPAGVQVPTHDDHAEHQEEGVEGELAQLAAKSAATQHQRYRDDHHKASTQ